MTDRNTPNEKSNLFQNRDVIFSSCFELFQFHMELIGRDCRPKNATLVHAQAHAASDPEASFCSVFSPPLTIDTIPNVVVTYGRINNNATGPSSFESTYKA